MIRTESLNLYGMKYVLLVIIMKEKSCEFIILLSFCVKYVIVYVCLCYIYANVLLVVIIVIC